jgi:plastocyanin
LRNEQPKCQINYGNAGQSVGLRRIIALTTQIGIFGNHLADRMNRPTHWLLIAVLITLSAHQLRADATVEGTVQLPKVTPAVPNTARYQNKIVGEVGPPDPPVAVIYLEGNFPATSITNARSVKMEQKHYQFAPGILPIQKGTSVEFPNLDDAYHNVFSYSRTRRFDLGRYRKDEKPTALIFDKPGVVKLYCEIHEHMRGTILVLDSPYFVKTDPSGKYRLEHLPTGTYAVKAWVNEKTIYSKTVDLKDGETLKVDFPEK